MMPRYLLLMVSVLFVLATACAPAAVGPTDTQSADSAAAPAATEEASEEGEHEDEHAEDEHEEEHEHEEDGEVRQLGAHEHGAAQLTIAWSGNDMAIDLETPAYNVLGFEYAPSTDEEIALLEESVAALEAGDLLQINAEAQCTVISAEVMAEVAEEGEAHEHGEGEETHSDIDVAYNVQCQQPDNITSLDASALFAQFPNFEGIQVQWVSDTQQSAGTLTAEESVLSFE